MQIGLFLMNIKGLNVLKGIINNGFANNILFVESRRDFNVVNDYFEEIKNLCKINKINFYYNRKINFKYGYADWNIAVGWRFMIKDIKNLIVLHDSLLPKYRGFAPIVNALINGEKKIGVTALLATSEYDRGDIITQEELYINYPIKIQNVIEKIIPLYIKIVLKILKQLIQKQKLEYYTQNEKNASYSVWRDEQDYYINWNWSACKIERFINAVGFPYKGAKTTINGEEITILDGKCLPDIKVEIIHPGKILFFQSGKPIVICGKGVLRIEKMKLGDKIYKVNKLKNKFV